MNNKSSSTVEKLEYVVRLFDLVKRRSIIIKIITVKRNGTVTFKERYPDVSMEYSLSKAKCSSEDFEELCNRIDNCISRANRRVSFIDDCSRTLKIYHRFDRVEIVDRGLGNESECIGDIMYDFLKKIKNVDGE